MSESQSYSEDFETNETLDLGNDPLDMIQTPNNAELQRQKQELIDQRKQLDNRIQGLRSQIKKTGFISEDLVQQNHSSKLTKIVSQISNKRQRLKDLKVELKQLDRVHRQQGKELEKLQKENDDDSMQKGVDINAASLLYITAEISSHKTKLEENKEKISRNKTRINESCSELKILRPRIKSLPKRIVPQVKLEPLHAKLQRELVLIKRQSEAVSLKTANVMNMKASSQSYWEHIQRSLQRDIASIDAANTQISTQIKELASQQYGTGIDDVLGNMISKIDSKEAAELEHNKSMPILRDDHQRAKSPCNYKRMNTSGKRNVIRYARIKDDSF